MIQPHRRLSYLGIGLAAFTLAVGCAGQPADTGKTPPAPDPANPPVTRPKPAKPGQTSFTTEDQTQPNTGSGPVRLGAEGGRASSGTAPPGAIAADSAAAPGGRVADVEEGDIYKIVGTRLYYLNTYKGFIVYDVADPKNPVRVSRLPVFGYPVEMFVEGTTVYALLRDSLYLTETNGKLEFARHNVSQLVTIDITDAAKPRVLKTLDIIGQLREGVARKIENTIYVVSYWNRNYWWGWSYERNDPQRQDQAYVYSFDVSNRMNPKRVGELKVFEGGAINFYDKTTGASFNRNFNAVYISATSNALMVVENWYLSASGGFRPGIGGCGYYNSDQQSVVSVVDVSDPKGTIRVHTKFETAGALTDQFKQTYVNDPVTKKGTYYGIFARRGWSSANCAGQQIIQNTIESWDITNGNNPTRIGRLDFGKPNETVRGTTFDTDRQVAFAITAQAIDPLYAISIADPKNLKILSAIDGLSGDISVFRIVGADKKFLLAVGRDTSITCAGVDASRGMSNIAVSIIDARDLTKIRLVQRQCVKIDNAAWVNSAVTWNLDQAHKMLGMHADGDLNVITVPVSYWQRNDTTQGWWYDRYQTAVGIMSWDLTRYDPAKPATQQTVIQNHGNFIHPNGEVRRSVLFTHPALKQRMMANLSDTHISLANIQNLMQPRLESIVEVAPYLNQLFRFGDYIVEQVQPRTDASYYDYGRSAVEFRVKRSGGDIDGATPIATFLVGQVQNALKHGNQLVVFRSAPKVAVPRAPGQPYVAPPPPKTEAVVFDLADPTNPRLAGRVDVPQDAFPYYRYYCGGYWSGFWWGDYGYYGGYYGQSSWSDTASGLVVARQVWDQRGQTSAWKLMFLDLRNPNAPKVTDGPIDLPKDSYMTALTVDAVDARGFYLGFRTYTGQARRENGTTFYQWKDHATRYDLAGDRWMAGDTENIPGHLIRTWRSADNQRMLLVSDYVSRWRSGTANGITYSDWAAWTRLSLLREIDLGGRPAAELLDARTFDNLDLSSLVADGDRLFVNGRRNYYYNYAVAVSPNGATSGAPMQDLSDRLMAFDLSKKTLNLAYDQSTRMFNVQLMGVHQGRLFANLAGDGILIADVSNLARPFGVQFHRTLGYATHIEFAGDDAYVGSGFFGTAHIDLRGLPSLDVN